jgi:long-chain acyl-CoA synthetase
MSVPQRAPRHDAAQTAVVVRHDGNELVVRHAGCEQPVTRVPAFPQAATLADLFIAACDARRDARAVGTRRVLGVQAAGQTAKKERRELGQYEWKSYGTLAREASAVGAGLRALGVSSGATVAILADTSAAWFTSCQGCLLEGITVATIYTSLGQAGVHHALSQCNPQVVFTDAAGARLIMAAKAPVPRLVLLPPRGPPSAVAQDVEHARAVLPPRAQLTTLADLVQEGDRVGPEGRVRPQPHDIALIMYTSGSTGTPKGVLIPHSAAVASVAGMVAWNQHASASLRSPLGALFRASSLPANAADTSLAYLPLAHIFELIAETAMLCAGVPLGYGSPYSLTDGAPAVAHDSRGDAPQLHPTLLMSVPAVLDRVANTVRRTVAAAPAPVRALFSGALAFNSYSLDAYGIYSAGAMSVATDNGALGVLGRIGKRCCSLLAPLLGAIVFRRPRAALGGNVRLILSGGAPLAPETQRFLQLVLGCPVLQGYGLTETCCAGTLTVPGDPSTGAVGGPVPSALIKLVPWPDGGYSPSQGHGEVHIGGPALAAGYFKQDDLTSRDFYTDPDTGCRWFRTGDIGAWDTAAGALRIVDRKKDLVKLSRGEYLALGKVESALGTGSKLVSQSMVVAEPSMRAPAVLAVPAMPALRIALAARGVATDGEDDARVMRLPMAEQVVLDDLRACGSSAGLEAWETPTKVRLVPGPWTPEQGLLTAALKVRRSNVKQLFKTEVDALTQTR